MFVVSVKHTEDHACPSFMPLLPSFTILITIGPLQLSTSLSTDCQLIGDYVGLGLCHMGLLVGVTAVGPTWTVVGKTESGTNLQILGQTK